MTQPSSQEQYLLELVNRFRTDPEGEYSRLINSGDADVANALNFFNVDRSLLEGQLSSLSTVQPLAWSNQLGDAAGAYSQLMIDFDQQSHALPQFQSPLTRANASGTTQYTAAAENIFAFSLSPFYAHAGFVVDWGDTPTGIQSPAGHRNSLIDNIYSEAGFSIINETNPNTAIGPQVVTQYLAARDTGTDEWLVGVAYRDMDDDNFYSVGEGITGLTVNIVGGSFSTSVQTGAAGEYQTLVPQQGTYSVEFFQGSRLLDTYSVSIGTQNVKQDLSIEIGVAPASGTGKIVGIQFDDINNNGVQDAGENGLAGRTVFLDSNGNRQRENGERIATTDADGVYIFNNLTPGTYAVTPVIPLGRVQTAPLPASTLGTEDFQIDSGNSQTNVVLDTNGKDVLVFNQFEASGEEVLSSIAVGLSPSSTQYSGLNNPAKLFIYQDKDGDDRPDGNEKILEVAPNLAGDRGFATTLINNTLVTGTFFVGALYEGTGISEGSASYTLVPEDTASAAGKSWKATSDNPNSFSAVSTTSNWLLRANGSGLQAQTVNVSANETIGGVNFSDRITSAITGTINSDTLGGTSGNDTILGFEGDDLLSGLAGNDTIDGGLDNDTLNGNGGADSLMGGSGNDSINGGADSDEIRGELGDDMLFGNGGDDSIFGDENDDFLRGGDGKDVLRGGDGNDNLGGNSLRDRLLGEAGDDLLLGNQGPDVLIGGTQNDVLRGQGNDDTLTGVDPSSALPGNNEKDVLVGGIGADLFELGDANNPFYAEDGTAGFARILDLDLSEGDIVQLHGDSSRYTLSAFSGGTYIYYEANNGSSDLVGALNNVSLSTFLNGFSFI